MPALRRNLLPRMRDGRGRPARMPALLAPNDATTRTKAFGNAQVRAALAGFIALASLMALFFALLSWRVNTPELHLNFGGTTYDRLAGQTHE